MSASTWREPHGGRVDRGLHYQFDWAATLIELLGGAVPAGWDGRSFAAAFDRPPQDRDGAAGAPP